VAVLVVVSVVVVGVVVLNVGVGEADSIFCSQRKVLF
jgi:hypothetical protein